jgi:hypothetical protein
MAKNYDSPERIARPATMRPLLLKNLHETVQSSIRKRAWRDDMTYEEAAAELLHDAEIDRIAQHDIAMMRRHHRFDDEDELPF